MKTININKLISVPHIHVCDMYELDASKNRSSVKN